MISRKGQLLYLARTWSEVIEENPQANEKLGLKMTMLQDSNGTYILVSKRNADSPHHGELVHRFNCNTRSWFAQRPRYIMGGYIKVKANQTNIEEIQINNRSALFCTTKEIFSEPGQFLSDALNINFASAQSNGFFKFLHGPNRRTCTLHGDDKENFKVPRNFEDMEIESKWSMPLNSRNFMQTIYDDLSDSDSAREILNLENIRGEREAQDRYKNERPAKFIDIYYKNANGTPLYLRHRSHFVSKNAPKRLKGDLEDLRSSKWKKDWEKLQYKLEPLIDDAVWYRKEVGGCFLKHTDKRYKNKLCSPRQRSIDVEDILEGLVPHIAIESIPRARQTSTYTPSKIIEDYRQRILIKSRVRYVTDKSEEKVRDFTFELSLDHLVEKICREGQSEKECLRNQGMAQFEVELEIKDDIKDENRLFELYRLSKLLEKKYGLIPSREPKGSL